MKVNEEGLNEREMEQEKLKRVDVFSQTHRGGFLLLLNRKGGKISRGK